ncbi:MAG: hypothetical protein WCH34_01590 [Bacteroidota bacterium]
MGIFNFIVREKYEINRLVLLTLQRLVFKTGIEESLDSNLKTAAMLNLLITGEYRIIANYLNVEVDLQNRLSRVTLFYICR